MLVSFESVMCLPSARFRTSSTFQIRLSWCQSVLYLGSQVMKLLKVEIFEVQIFGTSLGLEENNYLRVVHFWMRKLRLTFTNKSAWIRKKK